MSPDHEDAGPLTVAVTGPTGTFGSGLVPLLEQDPRVGRIIGIARRPFDPRARGLTKLEYRQGDVRDLSALSEAFHGADVVVHLAFMITGTAPRATIRTINVDGTLNAFRAAAGAGVRRFVYASSVAAYGFHPGNPSGMPETWPTQPDARLFYAQEKAELEILLDSEQGRHPSLAVYRLRPPIVVGPHTVGGKTVLPAIPGLPRLTARVGRLPRSPVPVPVLASKFPLQLIHEVDVGQALLLCTVAAGPPGAYNIAGDGVLTVADVAREFGFLPVPVPAGVTQAAAALAARVPFLPPAAQWVQAASHPAIMDTTKAKKELGWRPRYTGLEALRSTLGKLRLPDHVRRRQWPRLARSRCGYPGGFGG
jgi:nucleoside-diphosphate-sugar epimerase